MHVYGGLNPPVIDQMRLCDFYVLCEWAERRETEGS
jgi:hypothetical protein